MLYVFAAIGALTVAALLWRAFGPEKLETTPRRSMAPDDDPDFLRKLGEQSKKRPDEGTDS